MCLTHACGRNGGKNANRAKRVASLAKHRNSEVFEHDLWCSAGRRLLAARRMEEEAAAAATVWPVATGMGTGAWLPCTGEPLEAGWRHCQRGLAGGGRRSATAMAHGEGVMGVYVLGEGPMRVLPFAWGSIGWFLRRSKWGAAPMRLAMSLVYGTLWKPLNYAPH